jgi:hypothetical protein
MFYHLLVWDKENSTFGTSFAVQDSAKPRPKQRILFSHWNFPIPYMKDSIILTSEGNVTSFLLGIQSSYMVKRLTVETHQNP